MEYYILDTLEQFNECNDICYAAHMEVYNDGNGYRDETECWSSLPIQRLTDNKYICPVCKYYDNANGYVIEESQENWFPESEE